MQSSLLSKMFSKAVAGDRRSLAKSISAIENCTDGVLNTVAGLSVRRQAKPGTPHVIGITGPPGAGKSTFLNVMVTIARAESKKVAVVAVDPSSPFSNGAILGDRLRLDKHSADQSVFIRSLANRGHLGGLSRATGQVVDLLDAAGFDLILLETVGVGQSELAVMEVADTVVVILTPESGDTVQTMKAGLLEVGDLFVVNKSDRSGSDLLVKSLEQMVYLDMDMSNQDWLAPVLSTSALAGENSGVECVVSAAADHLKWCCGDGLSTWRSRRAAGRVRTFVDLVAENVRIEVSGLLNGDESTLRDSLLGGDLSPYLAASQWVQRIQVVPSVDVGDIDV